MKFDNATLNKVWTRIVNATTALCGNIGGTGFKHVHDALIRYTGLSRSKTPTTPGDYLKGIAVCARHIGGGHATSASCSLLDIAIALENFGFTSTEWNVRDVTWEGNFWISNGYLYVGGDPWEIVRADSGASVGWVYPDTPYSLLLLDTRTDYYVVSGVGGGTGCRLVHGDGSQDSYNYLFQNYYFEAYQEYELGACEPATVYYLYDGRNEYSSMSNADGLISFENENGTILMSGNVDWSTGSYKWVSNTGGTFSIYRK